MKVKLNNSQIDALPQNIGEKEKINNLILFKIRDAEYILDESKNLGRYVSFTSATSGYKMIRTDIASDIFSLEKTFSKRSLFALILLFILITIVILFLSYNSENFIISVAKAYLGFSPFLILTILYVYLMGVYNRKKIFEEVKNTFTIL